MISQMRAPHPSSGTWLAKGRAFAENTLKRGATIYNDSSLDNHDVHPHPHYALASIGMLGEARLAYKLHNVAMPADVQLALTQNVLAVFDQHLSNMDVGGTWNFVGPAARYSHMACTNNVPVRRAPWVGAPMKG